MMKPARRVVTTDQEIDAAIARGNEYEQYRPKAISVAYRAKDDVVEIRFVNGVSLIVPRKLLHGLERATPAQLRDVAIVEAQSALHWNALDVDQYIPGLIDGLLGSREWMSQLGRLGGSSRSVAKASAARQNGSKGGRPRGSV